MAFRRKMLKLMKENTKTMQPAKRVKKIDDLGWGLFASSPTSTFQISEFQISGSNV